MNADKEFVYKDMRVEERALEKLVKLSTYDLARLPWDHLYDLYEKLSEVLENPPKGK